MSQQQETDFTGIGYKIDHAYAMADRYLVNSDQWHKWMDEAKQLEDLAKRPRS